MEILQVAISTTKTCRRTMVMERVSKIQGLNQIRRMQTTNNTKRFRESFIGERLKQVATALALKPWS